MPLPFKEAIFNDPNQRGNYELKGNTGSVGEVKVGAPLFGGGLALLCDDGREYYRPSGFFRSSQKFAKIPDCNISPSQMPDCTITAEIFLLKSISHSNTGAYVSIFRNDEWFRGINQYDP